VAATQKISVAMGRDELRLARTAAEEEGLSLSAYVTRAVRERLEARRRAEAALEVLATFSAAERATPEERQKLLELWASPPPPPPKLATRKRRRGG
jgi:hypothetical protein